MKTLFIFLFVALSACMQSYIYDEKPTRHEENNLVCYKFKGKDIGCFSKGFRFNDDYIKDSVALVKNDDYYFINVHGKPIDNNRYELLYVFQFGYGLRNVDTMQYHVVHKNAQEVDFSKSKVYFYNYYLLEKNITDIFLST